MTHGTRPDSFDPTAVGTGERLLDVHNLKTHFDTRDGVVKAVDGIDFHVDKGEVLEDDLNSFPERFE